MKKLLFILLFTIPFVGFGQNLDNSIWKITDDDGYGNILVLNSDGTFDGINNIYGTPGIYMSDDESGKETWEVDGTNIILIFNNGWTIRTGKIISDKILSGTYTTIKGLSGEWFGERIN